MDDACALVTMGELAQFKEEHETLLPSFKTLRQDAEVIGEEVLTLRPEEQGTQTLFVNTMKIPKGTWRRTGVV